MRFSIVTPSFNQGCYLADTIRSVSRQSYPDYEHIVVDGASNDNTAEILENYRDCLSKVISEKDKGQADAINKGFAFAEGDIFAYINSDDYYFRDVFSIVADHFRRNPDVDVIYGNCVYVDREGQFLHYFTGIEQFDKSRLLNNVDMIMQPASFWRREVFEKHGPFNTQNHYGFDWAYWCELAVNGCKFLKVDDVLAVNRVHGDTKTLTGSNERLEELKAINQKYKTKMLPHAYYGFSREEYRSRTKKTLSDYLKLAMYSLLSYENIFYYFRNYKRKVINGVFPVSDELLKRSQIKVPNLNFSQLSLSLSCPDDEVQSVSIYQGEKSLGLFYFNKGRLDMDVNVNGVFGDVDISFEFSSEYRLHASLVLRWLYFYKPAYISARLEKFQLS